LGTINGNQIIFKRQVDDFAIAMPDKKMTNILLDMIDDELSIPMKWQGFLDMYNGIDVLQARDYIKITCKTFINKICDKYLTSWMQNFTSTEDPECRYPLTPHGSRSSMLPSATATPKCRQNLPRKCNLLTGAAWES
jgi:hypothetical protein